MTSHFEQPFGSGLSEPAIPHGDEVMPAVSDFQGLPQGASRVWRLTALIRSFVIVMIVVTVLAIIYAADGFGDDVPALLIGVGVSLVALLAGLHALLWPTLKWRHTEWRLTDDAIELNSGVIWRREMTVPRARIQHTEVTEGPLQRKYRLGSLTIYTAGERYADVTISGLTIEDARSLRDQLLNRTSVHVV